MSPLRSKQVIEITPHVFYIGETMMLDCNVYLVENSAGQIVMIDTGNGASFGYIIEAMKKAHKDPMQIKEILITHEHLDHVLGLYQVIKEWKDHVPIIYAHESTANILKMGDEETICPSQLGIPASHFGVEIKPLEIQILRDGDIHQFGNLSFQVIESLGHSVGPFAYYETTTKCLFPGDVVFPEGSFGRYDFPGGSLSKLQKSISNYLSIDIRFLCAGHMEPVDHALDHIKTSLANISGQW